MDTNKLEDTVRWINPAQDEDDFGQPDYQDTGEGGLMVYAVWGYYTQSAPSFLSEVSLNMTELLVSAHGPEAQRILGNEIENKRARNRGRAEPNPELYASVVLLGSTGASLYSKAQDSYFQVTREDLTEKGLTILQGLEALYGEEATLLTFLDT